MQGVVVDDIEPTAAQFGHQPQIGVVFAEERDVGRLRNTGRHQRGLVADCGQSSGGIRARRREQDDVMPACAQSRGEKMRVHLEPPANGSTIACLR